jgi:hypothetical protein
MYIKVKIKVTLVLALKLCSDRKAHRGGGWRYSFAASIFFAHKKRSTPCYSIVVHVFRDAAIL